MKEEVKKRTDEMTARLLKSLLPPGSPEASPLVPPLQHPAPAAAAAHVHKTVSILAPPPLSNGAAAPPSAPVAAPAAVNAAPASTIALIGKQCNVWVTTHEYEYVAPVMIMRLTDNGQGFAVKDAQDNVYAMTLHDASKSVESWNRGDVCMSRSEKPFERFEVLSCKNVPTTMTIEGSWVSNGRGFWFNATSPFKMYPGSTDHWHISNASDCKAIISSRAPAKHPHEVQDWEIAAYNTTFNFGCHNSQPIYISFKGFFAQPHAATGVFGGAGGGPAPGSGDSRDSARSPGSSDAGAAGGRAPASGGASGGASNASAASSAAGSSISALLSADAASADDAANSLKPGDVLCLCHPPEHEQEAFCFATIVALVSRVGQETVTYTCDRRTQGLLDDGTHGEMSYEEALLCRQAVINEKYIREPHTGPFIEVIVTHSAADWGAVSGLMGTYRLCDLVTHGSDGKTRPVFRKNVTIQAVVSYLWCSVEDKWVFGTFYQMHEDGGKKGFAVAVKSTLWAHYTQDFLIEGNERKIFMYAKKSEPQSPIDLRFSEDEDDTAASVTASAAGTAASDAGASDAGTSAALVKPSRVSSRPKKQTERARPDEETQLSMMRAQDRNSREKDKKRRKKTTVVSLQGAAGGSRGAGGAAGGGADGAAGGASVSHRMGST